MALELELPAKVEEQAMQDAMGQETSLEHLFTSWLELAQQAEKQKIDQLVTYVLETPQTQLGVDPYTWQELHTYGVDRMKSLCAARFINYEALNDEELEALVGELVDG